MKGPLITTYLYQSGLLSRVGVRSGATVRDGSLCVSSGAIPVQSPHLAHYPAGSGGPCVLHSPFSLSGLGARGPGHPPPSARDRWAGEVTKHRPGTLPTAKTWTDNDRRPCRRPLAELRGAGTKLDYSMVGSWQN